MKIHSNHTSLKSLLSPYLVFFFLLVACSDKELHPDDVEYRRDENGTQILHQLGNEKPFGTSKRAFIVDYYKDGNDHFKIGFVDGLRDGNFTFWQKNGLALVRGAFKKGKRNGLFIAYGKTGELVYEKSYLNGELDGMFKLYYPSSPSDVIRYKDKLEDESMKPGELEVTNHLRLDASFSDGKPVGPYRSYFHPKGKILTLDELLREEGSFDENGVLSEEQYNYYPQTHALVVNMPDNKRLETIHPASSDGFSRAIDEAAKKILEIPSYRNPNNAPALVCAIDERGNEITPIWSSHIQEIAIRNMDGFLLDDRFNATYEDFVFDAMNLANETLLAIDTTLDPEILSQFERQGASVEIVGLDKRGVIIDILWSSKQSSDIIPLDERIDRKRTKLKRTWQNGTTSEANWLLSNGSQINIKNEIPPFNSNQFLR
ncbi:MAG: hypothetical protein P8O23_04405 [Opitutales bacterium]|nr:hypothetical protein [Opitutales bacterium]